MLLLRRFGALVSAPSQGVADANASGTKAAPLLARALERCIRQHSHAHGDDTHAASDGSDDEDGADGPSVDAHKHGGGDDGDGDGQPGKARLWHRAKRVPAGQSTVLLLAAVEAADSLPPDVRRCFTHEVDVLPPDEPTRALLLKARIPPSQRLESVIV